MDKIKGKVAAIIDSGQMVINRGKSHSVVKDMIFSVHLNLPSIKDPEDSSNILGSLIYEKGRLQIKAVFEKMAVGSLLAGSMHSTVDNPISNLLNVDDKYAMIKKEDWRIRVGDNISSIDEGLASKEIG